MKDNSAQWFEYDWPLDGPMARFGADMALIDADRAARPLLMYVSCQSRSEKRETLSAIERSIASGVKDKLIKKLGALYAGYIEIDAQIQYYFYIHDAEEFERGETIAEKTPLMDCTAGLADEPDWLTYKTLLYPDAAKLQTELNRDHIALMKKHGDCISAVRRVTFTVYFPTESIMLNFAEAARRAGFAYAGPNYSPERELAYGADIVRLSSLKKADVDALTTRVINLAAQYGGELGEWSAPIVDRGGPLNAI